jgi:hypothetical protein
MAEEHFEYGEETQRVLLSFMMSNAELYTRSCNIIKEDYFDDHLRSAVRFIQKYSNDYKAIPTPEQLKAQSGVQVTVFDQMNEAHGEWYLDTIESFCRHRAIENVILDGAKFLEKGQYGEIERRLKDAMLISLTRDLGSDYFSDPLGRLKRLRDTSNLVSTGWKNFDDKLFGGLSKGGLHIFCGGPGSGKSLWMQNLALNWVEMGKNILYITLELSQDLTDLRIDHMVSGLSRGQIFADVLQAAAIISAKAKNCGNLTTKKFSEGGTTANDLRAYIKEYIIQRGYAPDAICVDYLDLMHPASGGIDLGNLFVKDKYVSEELRAIAGDYDIPLVTASQLNRSAVESSEFDHSHIAGGISKINTADNVFAILYTTSMRERGEYELQFLKTRSASAVGHKIKLAVSSETLRITEFPNSGPPKRETPQETRDELKRRTEDLANSKPVHFGDFDTAPEPEVKAGLNSLMSNLRNGIVENTK